MGTHLQPYLVRYFHTFKPSIILDHGRGHSPTSPIVRLAPLNNSPHNNQSPVTGGERTTSVYTNLPDIMSPSSPLLSTIHEDLSLPRSVMMESGKLFVIDFSGVIWVICLVMLKIY